MLFFVLLLLSFFYLCLSFSPTSHVSSRAQADIIVSELLGSFGDNELSPECLDGAQHVLERVGMSD